VKKRDATDNMLKSPHGSPEKEYWYDKYREYDDMEMKMRNYQVMFQIGFGFTLVVFGLGLLWYTALGGSWEIKRNKRI